MRVEGIERVKVVVAQENQLFRRGATSKERILEGVLL